MSGTLYVAGARSVFGADGAVNDEATERRIQRYIDGFAAFVRGRLT